METFHSAKDITAIIGLGQKTKVTPATDVPVIFWSVTAMVRGIGTSPRTVDSPSEQSKIK